MPELPEVETIVEGLRQKIVGKKIKRVEILDKKIIAQNKKKLPEELADQIVKTIRRRAKMIIIELSNAKFVLIHLKMTGQLIYKSQHGQIIAGGHPIKGAGQKLPNKFSRIIFIFDDQSRLYFNDVRRFGWVKLVDQSQFEKIDLEFGVEPLSQEFSLKKFQEILVRRKKIKIKQVLMEQKYLVGIGNIYSDEALFAARIKPTRLAGSLSDKEIKDLWHTIPKILKYSIKHRGTSFNDYIDSDGEAGNFIKYLKVYGRQGESCHGCGGRIIRLKIGGRSSHYCDKCQK